MYYFFLAVFLAVGFYNLHCLSGDLDRLSEINDDQAQKIRLLQIDLAREREKYKSFKWSCAREND